VPKSARRQVCAVWPASGGLRYARRARPGAAGWCAIPWIALALLGVSGRLWAGAAGERAAVAARPQAGQAQAQPAPVLGGWGDLGRLPLKAATAEVSRLAESGATSVRLLLDWNRVERQPNRFNWKADDAVVRVARARGLEVVLVLGNCASWAVHPAWQVPARDRCFSVPRALALWERYVRQSARHFRGRVRYWQIREQPNPRNFRGARSEYLRLVSSAARIIRALDPKARVILPEAGELDVAEVDRVCSSSLRAWCDVLGLYLPAALSDASGPALAWAVLTQEVLAPRAASGRPSGGPGEGTPTPATGRPPRPAVSPDVWVLGGDPDTKPEHWMQQYLLASAFGVRRVYLPTRAIEPSWAKPLVRLRYIGFLRLGPEVWALSFEDGGVPVVAAWSGKQTDLRASDLAPVADREAVKQAGALGASPGSAVVDADGLKLRLGPRPALIRGLDLREVVHRGPPTRAAVLAARPGQELASRVSVRADYGAPDEPELGLYNRSLRGRIGGKIEEELRDGRVCLRTRILPGEGLGSPWIYFDVDDSWLYLARGKTPVAITVECQGAYLGERMLGFNIMYDSTTGYRFTPWQWVEARPGWHRYRFELRDVSFGNRDGYDFRINAQGSKQDLWVASVMVEKLQPGR